MNEIQISYYLRINNLLVQIMEQLKQYVDDGQLEIAKLDNNNKAHKVEYSQLEGQVSRQQKNAKLYKSLEDLTWDEKFEWVTLKRLKGKEIFKEGDYNTAIEIYTEALIGIDLNDKTQSRLSQMKNQLQYPITLNIATCLYMKKQYKRALEICDKVLKQNGNYLPAIYKKVYLLMTCGEHVQAKQLLNYGIKIARQTHQQKQLKEFIQLNGDLMKSAKQNKNFYAKMFNKESDSQDETVDSESSRLISKQQEVVEEEEVLYYEDGFNICGKLSRFGKKLLYFVVPSMNPKNKNKKHINHSKSF